MEAGYKDGIPFGFDENSDIINGYQFSATMQLRTPLKYLEMHGQTHPGPSSDLPKIPMEHGIWLPKMKSWKELGINLKELPESTMASDIGPIPESGGIYLEFLKAFRTIVELDIDPVEKEVAIALLDNENPAFAPILKNHPELQGNKINQWLGYTEILGIPGFNATLARAIYEAGFKNAQSIANATDVDLLSINGIGPDKIRRIRELQLLSSDGKEVDDINKEVIKRENIDSKDVIPYVLANYERATDFGIGDAETQLRAVEPFNPDLGLLYALRISVCLPKLKKLDTLASRWNTACLGAGKMGLMTSNNSKYYQMVYDFLAERFLIRFTEIADACVQKAKTIESTQNSQQAKINCWYDVYDKINAGREAFVYELPSLDGVFEAFEKDINDRIEKIKCS